MLSPIPEVKGVCVTINVTSDCNLRCKYCYELNKKPGVIRKDQYEPFIDMLLSDQIPLYTDIDTEGMIKSGYRLDLLGGDALMYPEVCEDIIRYFTKKLVQKEGNNKYHFIANICSNGTLFGVPRVRKLLYEYRDFIQCCVSIDGCPELHDLNRVDKVGNGSMKSIMKYWDWYREMFPLGSKYTKSTLNEESIPYIYDSLKFMFEELGIVYVYQNFIMEGLHTTPDDIKELDRQLEKCVEYVLDHDDVLYYSMLDKSHSVQLIQHHTDLEKGWCGSGAMPSLGLDGKIYLCPRWMSLCMESENNSWAIGDVVNGITNPELSKYIKLKSARKLVNAGLPCETCSIEQSCPYCIAGAVDYLGEWKRNLEYCDTTKVQGKWAEIYWTEYYKKHPELTGRDER